MKMNFIGKLYVTALGAVVLLGLTPVALVSAQSSGAPYVSTTSYSDLTQSSVTLNGFVNPNGLSTTAWFEYGTSNSLGQTSSTFSAGNVSYQTSVSSNISNLNPGNTYYYRVVAKNVYGTSQGSILSFSTGNSSYYNQSNGNYPIVATGSATLLSSNSATFYGSVNPNNSYVTTWFEYGPTASLGNSSQATSISSNSSYVNTSASAFNLNANTTYYYRAVAQNSFGNAYGSILSIYTGSNNTFTTNNQDLSGLSTSLSKLNPTLSEVGKTVDNGPVADTKAIVEKVVQVSSTSNDSAKLTLTADKSALKSGDAVVITAEINAITDINKASLQINLDPSLVFDSSVAPAFNKNGNTITFDINDIAANGVRTVKLNTHLSKDTDTSKVTKATTTGVLNFSDSTGKDSAPLLTSLDVKVGSQGLFASIFGALNWGSGLTIFLIVALILLIVVATKRLMV